MFYTRIVGYNFVDYGAKSSYSVIRESSAITYLSILVQHALLLLLFQTRIVDCICRFWCRTLLPKRSMSAKNSSG